MSASPYIQELPYQAESHRRFSLFADHPWSIWLDSAGYGLPLGRYDIFVADPVVTLTTEGAQTTLTQRGGDTTLSTEEPLRLLRRELSRLGRWDTPQLPFIGGAIGYFGYELAHRLSPLLAKNGEPAALPEMAVGIYEWAYIADHQLCRSWLVGLPSESLQQRWQGLCRQFIAADTGESSARQPLVATSPLQSTMDEAHYAAAFSRIQHYLQEGDCYQVNLTRRFDVAVTGEPFAGYCRLRQLNSAPFSAYLNLPFVQILSSSPERFLRVTDRRVETRPIKGTRPRSSDAIEDKRLAEELRNSAKDRAENVMIVDLLRNDLGKCCTVGSVKVPELFVVESYATVHHLVSTVTGELAQGQDAIDLLRAAFPGGSITGAPKRRAMEIIAELESGPRNVYCGAIGYISVNGNMDTNIAIRTLLHHDGQIHFWAGGGIVIGSELQSEFQETLHKAAGMARLFDEGEGNIPSPQGQEAG